MAAMRVKKQADLKNCRKSFESWNNYQKIMRFGNEKLKTELQNYTEYIKKRNKNARLQDFIQMQRTQYPRQPLKVIIEKQHIFLNLSAKIRI